MINDSDRTEKFNNLLTNVSDTLKSRSLFIVSNRGPIEHHITDDDRIVQRRGSGGVVTALNPLFGSDFTWVSNAMGEGDRRVARNSDGEPIRSTMPGQEFSVKYVLTSRRVYHKFYNIFCNPLLWFLHHNMWSSPYTPNIDNSVYDAWETGYVPVNRAFADSIIEECAKNNKPPSIVIHDYHLYMVPGMLRQAMPESIIQQFIHIPWPDSSYWQMLPSDIRTNICESLIMTDTVAFQNFRDVRNFLQSCEMFVLGSQVNYENCTVTLNGHTTEVKHRPMGISVEEVRNIAESNRAHEYEDKLKSVLTENTIVRVDRVEPSKNIIRGFRAYRLLLERNPDILGKVTFLAFMVPSRTHIRQYQRYFQEVEELVTEINDSFGNGQWKPILPFYDNNYTQAMAAMKFYDVLLVNPIMDGMNLVSKEGPIVNGRSGVLVLSETAGSYDQLRNGVLSVSPADIEGTYRALQQALEMPIGNRKELEEILIDKISDQDVIDWARKLFSDLNVYLD